MKLMLIFVSLFLVDVTPTDHCPNISNTVLSLKDSCYIISDNVNGYHDALSRCLDISDRAHLPWFETPEEWGEVEEMLREHGVGDFFLGLQLQSMDDASLKWTDPYDIRGYDEYLSYGVPVTINEDFSECVIVTWKEDGYDWQLNKCGATQESVVCEINTGGCPNGWYYDFSSHRCYKKYANMMGSTRGANWHQVQQWISTIPNASLVQYTDVMKNVVDRIFANGNGQIQLAENTNPGILLAIFADNTLLNSTTTASTLGFTYPLWTTLLIVKVHIPGSVESPSRRIRISTDSGVFSDHTWSCTPDYLDTPALTSPNISNAKTKWTVNTSVGETHIRKAKNIWTSGTDNEIVCYKNLTGHNTFWAAKNDRRRRDTDGRCPVVSVLTDNSIQYSTEPCDNLYGFIVAIPSHEDRQETTTAVTSTKQTTTVAPSDVTEANTNSTIPTTTAPVPLVLVARAQDVKPHDFDIEDAMAPAESPAAKYIAVPTTIAAIVLVVLLVLLDCINIQEHLNILRRNLGCFGPVVIVTPLHRTRRREARNVLGKFGKSFNSRGLNVREQNKKRKSVCVGLCDAEVQTDWSFGYMLPEGIAQTEPDLLSFRSDQNKTYDLDPHLLELSGTLSSNYKPNSAYHTNNFSFCNNTHNMQYPVRGINAEHQLSLPENRFIENKSGFSLLHRRKSRSYDFGHEFSEPERKEIVGMLYGDENQYGHNTRERHLHDVQL